MSRPDHVAFAEFYLQRYQRLLRSFIGQGANLSDVEDAAQAVFMRTFGRRAELRHPDAYLRQAMKNELAATAQRQRGDAARSVDWTGRHVARSAADIYHLGEADIVRECLTILPRRQREIMAWLYEGYRPDEVVDALGGPPSTIRSHRRHARKSLEPFVAGDGHELRRWMRSGERLHEAFHRGEQLPAAPRPVIGWAWQLAKNLGIDPEHGAETTTLSRDEVARRRRQSPVAACRWVLSALTKLAEATGQMMIIVDGDSVVLWRGGSRNVLDAADQLGFVEGAHWGMEHAGVNGIALALMIGTTVTVNRWEHSVQTHHGLSCVASPVPDPQTRRPACVLNLTGTQATVHPALKRQVDTIALRLHQQWRTMRTHRRQ